MKNVYEKPSRLQAALVNAGVKSLEKKIGGTLEVMPVLALHDETLLAFIIGGPRLLNDHVNTTCLGKDQTFKAEYAKAYMERVYAGTWQDRKSTAKDPVEQEYKRLLAQAFKSNGFKSTDKDAIKAAKDKDNIKAYIEYAYEQAGASVLSGDELAELVIDFTSQTRETAKGNVHNALPAPTITIPTL